MENELQRIHDKINYETNVVDPKTFAILLNAVRLNQPLSYVTGRDLVFPQARANAGMQWDKTKPDTHASNTLEQYSLVNSTEDRTISVSDLGYKFLGCFDSNYDLKVSDNYYKMTLLQMIFSWVELEHGRNIHPGRMLFKLMLDPDLEFYSTSNEFALWTSDIVSMTDKDYEKIKQLILSYRSNPTEIKQKKSEVFLRPFANSWGLFDREINGGVYTFRIKKEVEPLVKQFFIFQVNEESTIDETSGTIIKVDETQRLEGGTNILLYGVPGSGKSWTIQHEYCDDEKCMERLVFHPDYMYSDFVGQILPVVKKDDEGKEKVRYEFKPGPFTKILKKAYEDPEKSYYLVIEEINRGNAPAIFGEIFQLLDRMDEDKDGYKKGTSEYGITNENIALEVYGDADTKVRIPSNLSILGTMNTSDQNVFTLDTAFQRRWIMRMIKNSFTDHKYADKNILDTSVSWKQFCEAINEEILHRNNVTSSEDKRLGAYFVSADDLICVEVQDDATEKQKIEAKHKNARFAEKVIKYLWDDAFKFSHPDTFDTRRYKSLEKIIDVFNSSSKDARFNVFHENLRKLIIEGVDEDNSVSNEDNE